jgi:hypothetical protein
MIMRRLLLPLLHLAIFAALAVANPAPTDDEVAARKSALELAGAFSNEGFKLRDGHFAGQIKPGEPRLVQVNLYAGNEYYFTVAAIDRAKKMALAIFDEKGFAVPIEDPYSEGATAAVGFAPEASGSYYVEVSAGEGEPAAFCLVCSYK